MLKAVFINLIHGEGQLVSSSATPLTKTGYITYLIHTKFANLTVLSIHVNGSVTEFKFSVLEYLPNNNVAQNMDV